MRRFAVSLTVVLCLLGLIAGCSRTTYQSVRVPPRVDLTEHDLIAVVEFDGGGEDELSRIATRRFTDVARADQGLVRMLNVAPKSDDLDPTAIRALGSEHGARTVFVGRLEISDVKPKLRISDTLRSGSLTANVEATLTVDLVETASGASIWSSSARAVRTVGNVRMVDRKVRFDAEDPETAYAPLIDALVGEVTADFRATWIRQAVPR